MASDDQNPTQQDPTGQREVTTLVPADRVEQFEAFARRFLAIAEYRDRVHEAGEQLRRAGVEPRRGRGRHKRHGRTGRGRCARRAEGVAPEPGPVV